MGRPARFYQKWGHDATGGAGTRLESIYFSALEYPLYSKKGSVPIEGQEIRSPHGDSRHGEFTVQAAWRKEKLKGECR